MSALQNLEQEAGNKWNHSPRPMLHESISVVFTRSLGASLKNSMFDSLEQQMRVSQVEFGNSVKRVREKYVFSNVEAVQYFLESHRTVAPLLIEAAPHFAAAFGSQTPLVLEVLIEDEAPHSVYALAVWNGDGDEARTNLQKFDDGWLDRNLQAVNGRIVFDYELI